MLIVLLFLFCVVSITDLKSGICEKIGARAIEPLELFNLIQKEDNIEKSSARHNSENTEGHKRTSIVTLSSKIHVKDNKDDELSLKSRKLWSRWGKWGSCSVTCGEGALMRRRVCVAGRCAPGELEEQRRPCFKALCNTAHVDELHDQD